MQRDLANRPRPSSTELLDIVLVERYKAPNAGARLLNPSA